MNNVIEAAHGLFASQGYPATSIKEIASEAGVSEQNVDRVFGDKANLLRSVVLTAVGGADDAAPLRNSERMDLLARASTPTERLRIAAKWMVESYERGLAELENIVLAAAPADERVSELATEIASERYKDTRILVQAILGDTGLPSCLDVEDVVDYIYALESSPVYTMLTAERGWTTEKYATWFVRLFRRIFLDARD